jgi:hypothetical protein
MTKRIQELAEQARASIPPGLVVSKWIEVYNQKLGELIVQECCALIEQQGHNMVPGFFMRLTVPVEIDLIKKHFGVEQ